MAGKGSHCRPENLKAMVAMVPRARVVEFPGAMHSIHNWRAKDFDIEMKRLYKQLVKWKTLSSE